MEEKKRKKVRAVAHGENQLSVVSNQKAKNLQRL
jgi:hypothetical protein